MVCEEGTLDSIMAMLECFVYLPKGGLCVVSTSAYIPCSCSNGNISRDDVPS